MSTPTCLCVLLVSSSCLQCLCDSSRCSWRLWFSACRPWTCCWAQRVCNTTQLLRNVHEHMRRLHFSILTHIYVSTKNKVPHRLTTEEVKSTFRYFHFILLHWNVLYTPLHLCDSFTYFESVHELNWNFISETGEQIRKKNIHVFIRNSEKSLSYCSSDSFWPKSTFYSMYLVCQWLNFKWYFYW